MNPARCVIRRGWIKASNHTKEVVWLDEKRFPSNHTSVLLQEKFRGKDLETSLDQRQFLWIRIEDRRQRRSDPAREEE
jgi:hypothetical protein